MSDARQSFTLHKTPFLTDLRFKWLYQHASRSNCRKKLLPKVLGPIKVISAMPDALSMDENGIHSTIITDRVMPAPYNARSRCSVQRYSNMQSSNNPKDEYGNRLKWRSHSRRVPWTLHSETRENIKKMKFYLRWHGYEPDAGAVEPLQQILPHLLQDGGADETDRKHKKAKWTLTTLRGARQVWSIMVTTIQEYGKVKWRMSRRRKMREKLTTVTTVWR